MEIMDSKVCVDTDACIEVLKGTERGRKITDMLFHSQVYISVVTMFELLLRKSNLEAIEVFLSKVNTLPFTPFTARKAAELYKKMSEGGSPIEIRDLFIASCAASENMPVLTFNKKDFSKIPSLHLPEV